MAEARDWAAAQVGPRLAQQLAQPLLEAGLRRCPTVSTKTSTALVDRNGDIFAIVRPDVAEKWLALLASSTE